LQLAIVGTTKLGRAEKFHLDSLAAHRGKTVDHLIRQSVEDYLTRKSFGSCADVEEVLRQMGLDTKPFKSSTPILTG
jgi:predicted transcriptional regulator